ncbi:hypothetical protein AAFF_G00279830 [Aldrovandia affinis]|uniref:Integrase catalytic domain-containing protein n=1 Tax=Aldrovandia affinis TaxID=143900 RepID=A0AAD7SR83_9TELE|nr:hypothetical protein AAFF_G00279830 [Aldrovandia affinis]
MDRAAEKHCKECHGCQIVSRPDPPELLRPTPLPDGPWRDLAVDLLGPLPSNHSILVVVDYYSRYYEYDILASTTTEKVIDSLESIFSRHGLPVTLKSDNGPQFKSELFREYCENNGITHLRTTAKWAQANGEVERQNAALMKRIRIAHSEGLDWKRELRKYVTVYRSIDHATTGKSPAELLFNRKMRGKLPDVTEPRTDTEVRDRDSERKGKSKLYTDERRRARHSDVEINDQPTLKKYNLTVIDALDKPNVTCEVNNDSTLTLLCAGDQSPLTQYSWEGPDTQDQTGYKLLIKREESQSPDSVYTCVVKDPVSENREDFTVKSCFPAQGDDVKINIENGTGETAPVTSAKDASRDEEPGKPSHSSSAQGSTENGTEETAPETSPKDASGDEEPSKPSHGSAAQDSTGDAPNSSQPTTVGEPLMANDSDVKSSREPLEEIPSDEETKNGTEETALVTSEKEASGDEEPSKPSHGSAAQDSTGETTYL